MLRCKVVKLLELFSISEPTLYYMEGPGFEQGQRLLQGEPVYGPMGAHHQPPRPVKSPGDQQRRPVEELFSGQGVGCEPGWTHDRPTLGSNSKRPTDGKGKTEDQQHEFGGNKMEDQLARVAVSKQKEQKSRFGNWISPGTGLLGVVALGKRDDEMTWHF